VTTVRLKRHKAPAVRDVVFIEGLPGVGNVGKLACDHLVDVTSAKAWIDLMSTDFPPQVTVQKDGTVRLVRAQLWVAPKAADGRDLVIMTGDYQPLTAQGQHDLVTAVLDELEKVGCKEIFTTGGYGLGTSVDEPAVLGAATDTKVVKRLQRLGVRFEEDEPGGGIIGASGLFLGLAMERGMSGACLMGETSGFLVDPKAARAVLDVLTRLVGIEGVDAGDLQDKAAELDRIASQLSEAEAAARSDRPDLHYIG
jgi:hypothetical protein